METWAIFPFEIQPKKLFGRVLQDMEVETAIGATRTFACRCSRWVGRYQCGFKAGLVGTEAQIPPAIFSIG